MLISLFRLRLVHVFLVLLLPAAALAGNALATYPVKYEQRPMLRTFDGVLEAVRQSTVSSQTRGTIIEVNFDVHDTVNKGDVLVRLRDTEQRARLQSARARLHEAEARHAQASKEFNRISRIYARKLVARSAYDRAAADLKAASARLVAARAGVRSALEQLEYTVIRAPYSGIVVKRLVEPGETASPGTPLMTGLSLDHLRVQTHIPQSVINPVRRYARVSVTTGQAGQKPLATGRMVVFPYADPVTHSFRVRVELKPGHHGLYPGMMVKLAFVVGKTRQMRIPLTAVVHRGEVTAVYVMEKERITLRQIRIGQHDQESKVAVLSGLSEGDRIVLDPIAAGVRLKKQRAGKSK